MTKEQYLNLKEGDKVKFIGKNNVLFITNKIYSVLYKITTKGLSHIVIAGDYGSNFKNFELIPPNSVSFIKKL